MQRGLNRAEEGEESRIKDRALGADAKLDVNGSIATSPKKIIIYFYISYGRRC